MQYYLKLLTSLFCSGILYQTADTTVIQWSTISNCWHHCYTVEYYLKLLTPLFCTGVLSQTADTTVMQCSTISNSWYDCTIIQIFSWTQLVAPRSALHLYRRYPSLSSRACSLHGAAGCEVMPPTELEQWCWLHRLVMTHLHCVSNLGWSETQRVVKLRSKKSLKRNFHMHSVRGRYLLRRGRAFQALLCWFGG
jgi:hypothetical protein